VGSSRLGLCEDLLGGDLNAVSVSGVALGVVDALGEGVSLAVVTAVTHGPGAVVLVWLGV
jgi:hypothetical protein